LDENVGTLIGLADAKPKGDAFHAEAHMSLSGAPRSKLLESTPRSCRLSLATDIADPPSSMAFQQQGGGMANGADHGPQGTEYTLQGKEEKHQSGR
jgi:hypothetical protein